MTKRTFLALLCVVMGLGAWGLWSAAKRSSAPPRPAVIPDIAIEARMGALWDGQVWVRMRGVAHYAARFEQKHPASRLRDAETFHVFAFFPQGQEQERAIPILVRTHRKPEALVGFEVLTIEGWLSPIERAWVAPDTEEQLSGSAGYFFDKDVLILHAATITSEDGVYTEPSPT